MNSIKTIIVAATLSTLSLGALFRPLRQWSPCKASASTPKPKTRLSTTPPARVFAKLS